MVKLVRFKGKTMVLVGGALAMRRDYLNGRVGYAHLFEDGIIRRYGEEIGRKEDVKVLGEYTRRPKDILGAIVNVMTWQPRNET